MDKSSIINMARGAFIEHIEVEAARVYDNIMDPNTDAKKARSITVKFTFLPNAQRNIASVKCQATATLAPSNAIKTEICLDKDSSGNVVAAEVRGGMVGQTELDFEDNIKDSSKVVNMKK